MAEVLRSFDEPVRDESGAYHARVVGRFADDRMWEGWFEFVRIGDASADVIVGPVESRQPEREHLAYWASGLSLVYAEGALHRARKPLAVRVRLAEEPASQSPAAKIVATPRMTTGPEPILDPFEIGARSLDVLAQQLPAVGRARLLNIIAAYHLNPLEDDLQRMTDAQLVSFIVAAVENRLVRGM
jgi:hypothetical protein